jgi:biotin transporter BioY
MHGLFFQQREVQKQVFCATAFVAALIAYAFWENPDLVEVRYGIIITTVLMLLIGSPLLSLVSSVLKFDRNSGSVFSWQHFVKWILYTISE